MEDRSTDRRRSVLHFAAKESYALRLSSSIKQASMPSIWTSPRQLNISSRSIIACSGSLSPKKSGLSPSASLLFTVCSKRERVSQARLISHEVDISLSICDKRAFALMILDRLPCNLYVAECERSIPIIELQSCPYIRELKARPVPASLGCCDVPTESVRPRERRCRGSTISGVAI